MFGRKKKKEKAIAHHQAIRKGLLFWLPGGSSRLDVYLDYCVIRCLGKTKMKEKESASGDVGALKVCSSLMNWPPSPTR